MDSADGVTLSRLSEFGRYSVVSVRGLIAAALATIALSACDHQPEHWATRQVPIRYVSPVGDGESTRLLSASLDNCKADNPAPYSVRTVESATSVTITVVGPVWIGENQAACLNGVQVTLKAPLGSRLVIDGRTGQQVPVHARSQ